MIYNGGIAVVSACLIMLSNAIIIIAGATRKCADCGNVTVPFPLSTGPNCGHQSYKVRCTESTLWFDSLNGSSHLISSINSETQRLVIKPPGWVDGGACMSRDYLTQGITLDPNLPFNITSNNVIVLMNCSADMLQLTIDCTDGSICHRYLKENPLAAAASCGSFLCCSLKTGGSQNAHRIKLRPDRCAAYQSFVNLDTSLAMNKWPEAGLEIEWQLPEEPICKSQVDCTELVYSVCREDITNPSQRRCFCRSGFRWDPVHGSCFNIKCPKKDCKRETTLLAAGLACTLGVILFCATVSILIRRHRNQIGRKTRSTIVKMREDILNANTSGKSSKIFTGKEITKATNHFSKENLIGSGGFGEVFKAVLSDGTVTAIKRAKLGSTKGIDQILNEVRILCQVNHRNLVMLLGCCVDLEQPHLVYEYVPNGTLFDHLHGRKRQMLEPLVWSRRLMIARQVADGLAYLHNAAVPPIYHRDIKSSNILLDKGLNAKVSDFGLSKLVTTDATHITTCAQGTLGYLDPEYYLNFQLTDKTDVYSFGVVLLELVTSKKAIDFSRRDEDVNLTVLVRKFMKEGRLIEAFDRVLREGASELELETMQALTHLASACLDERRQNRPSMKEVADEIEYIIDILNGKGSQDHHQCLYSFSKQNSAEVMLSGCS